MAIANNGTKITCRHMTNHRKQNALITRINTRGTAPQPLYNDRTVHRSKGAFFLIRTGQEQRLAEKNQRR